MMINQQIIKTKQKNFSPPLILQEEELNSMAIANSLDFSLALRINITSNNRNPLHHSPSSKITKNPSPLISLLFLNLHSRPVKSNSSSHPSPLLEDEVKNTPVIELALNLQNFQPDDDDDNNNDKNSSPEDDHKQLNAHIITLFKDSQTESLGFDRYQKAKRKPGFKPHKHTLKLVVRYLIRSNDWVSLFSLSEDIKDFDILPDKSTCGKLISTCVKARKLQLVDSFLEAFLVSGDVEVCVVAFDYGMRGYNQLHMYSSTCALYQRMKSSGVGLSPSCCARIMEAYLKMGHYDKVITMFEDFECRKMVSVEGDETSRIYWILCEALGKTGRHFEALEYFREMSRKGGVENHSIYSSLISSFASAGEVKIAEELLEEAEMNNMLKDPSLFLKIVLKYIDEGLMEKTLDVVKMMKRVNIRVSDCIFCAIVNGFSKKRGVRAAAQVYEDLVSEGCEPGQVTYASVLNMYLRLGLYPKAETVFSEMERKGYRKCVVAYSSMVTAYGKMGRTRDAMRLVAKMKERGCEPNVWIYNALLDMNGKALNLRLVEKTWKEMKRRRVLPDRVSYTTLISAYNLAREFEMCVKCYDEFKLTGGKIDKAMAGIMVSVFSKLNRVDEIVVLLQDMKIQGTKLDSRFYRSAMNALRDAGLQVQARWLEEMFKNS